MTARGAPVPNAKVGGVRLESEDIYSELSPLPAGPEGRRQAWCQPGEYRLAALAPGFAASFVKLTVKEGGAKPVARFELTTGHSLSGRVLDKDSEQPLPGAQLSVQFLDDDFNTVVPDASATSDARGQFRLDTLVEGTYQIEVQAPGHTDASLEVEVPSQQSVSIELEGTCPARRPGRRWLGRSRSRRECPGRHLRPPVRGLGRADGRAGALLPRGQRGHLPARRERRGPGGHSREQGDGRARRSGGWARHPPAPTGSLKGKAFVQSSQEPVKGAFLSIRHGDSGWSRSAQTKEDGTFSVEGLLPGQYGITLYKGGFSDLRRADVSIEPGQQATVELALFREATLQGTVMDSLGHPAEEATLLATLVQGSEGKHRVRQGSIDESGHYDISGLFPGTYLIEARLSSESPPVSRELTLREGETARADFVLQDALGTVEGTVRRASGGPPVYAVIIAAKSAEMTHAEEELDEQGHFTLKLTPGEYTFAASYTDTQDEGIERPVRVEAGKLVRVTLTVPDKVAETSGVVLNARGEPVPAADVLMTDGDELSSQTSADNQGRFTLVSSLSTVGKTVTVSAENGAEQGSLQNVRVGSRNLVVRLEKASALRGRIVAVQGAPVQGFELQAFKLGEDNDSDRLGARPFVGDTFEWVDLPAGTVELRVRTTDGRTGKMQTQLASGRTTTVELPVGRLASVTGRSVNASGAPVMQRVVVDADTPGEQRLYPAPDGRFEIIALEPGKHRIVIGTTHHILVELRDGEALDVGSVLVGSGPR